jgi:hypothetical protein
MTTSPAPPVASPATDLGKRIDQYIKLRNTIAEIKKKQEEVLKPYKDALEMLNNTLLSQLINAGVDNASSDAGTVYKYEKPSATIADASTFRDYVINNELWDVVDWRANAPQVREFIEANGTPPPGVNWSTRLLVGVRKS